MGQLIDGKWHDVWYDTKANKGRFVREQAGFRDWVTVDGTAGPTGVGGFAAESGRYHLYVSHACPWAHRTLIMRSLKGLENHVSVSVVNYLMAEHGWTFDEAPGVVGDPECSASYLYQVYTASEPKYTGRATVPILWDKKQKCIVSNESSEILRMFSSAFDQVGASPGDYRPAPLRDEIDRVNKRVYGAVNNGVYKSGFATSQEAYEEAVGDLFATLDWLDGRLAKQRYLVGRQITEADWRLFTTLVRFDPVYVGHFKCNLRRISDYANLAPYTRDLYQQPGIASTVKMDHIKGHYYESHVGINPTRVVPVGPVLDLDAAHGRESLP